MSGTETPGPGAAGIPRRSFLKVGAIGTAAVAAGGVALALRQTVLRDLPKDGLMVFTPKEYAIFAAVADIVCPPRAEGVPNATDLDVARTADRQLAKLDVAVQKEFKILLNLFDSALAGFLFDGRLKPFTQLSPAKQAEAFMAWGDSGVPFRRTAFEALKRLAGAMYYIQPSIWERTGYNGPPDVSGYREAIRQKREAAAREAPAPEEPR